MNTKLIISILAVLVLSASSVFAAATTVIHGKVLNPDSSEAGSGIAVTVQCDHEGIIAEQNPVTDANSEYQAEFDDEDCWVGDTVYASVPGDERSATVVDDETVLGSLIIQINLEVPEFSAIAAGIAFAGAGAGFLLLRKRS